MSDEVIWCPGMTLEALEKLAILKAFRLYRGNKTMTAKVLDISIRTLDHKLDKYKQQTIEQEVKDDIVRQSREEYQKRARGLPQEATERLGMHPGVRMEPTSESREKSKMPMPKRKEV